MGISGNANFLLEVLSVTAVGAAGGYIGSAMLSERMALGAGPMGHLAMPGMALALKMGVNVSIGASLMLLLGSGFIWLLSTLTSLPLDAATAAVFSAAIALSMILVPQGHEHELVAGISGGMSQGEAIAFILISIVASLLMAWIYNRLLLCRISKETAASVGIRPAKTQAIYLVATALLVATGVRLVGGLMTAAITAIPAAIAKISARDLTSYKLISALVGGSCGAAGMLIANHFNLPEGPVIILTLASLLLVAAIVKRARERVGSPL